MWKTLQWREYCQKRYADALYGFLSVLMTLISRVILDEFFKETFLSRYISVGTGKNQSCYPVHQLQDTSISIRAA